MLSDLIWDIATSNLVLAIIALALLAAFAIAHLPFGRWIPVVAPYVVAATLAAHVLFGLLAFLVGFRISDDREEAKRLKGELAWSENQLKQQKASADDKARLARQAEERAAAADQKVTDYETALAKLPAGNCSLDDADIRGLLGISR